MCIHEDFPDNTQLTQLLKRLLSRLADLADLQAHSFAAKVFHGVLQHDSNEFDKELARLERWGITEAMVFNHIDTMSAEVNATGPANGQVPLDPWDGTALCAESSPSTPTTSGTQAPSFSFTPSPGGSTGQGEFGGSGKTSRGRMFSDSRSRVMSPLRASGSSGASANEGWVNPSTPSSAHSSTRRHSQVDSPSSAFANGDGEDAEHDDDDLTPKDHRLVRELMRPLSTSTSANGKDEDNESDNEPTPKNVTHGVARMASPAVVAPAAEPTPSLLQIKRKAARMPSMSRQKLQSQSQSQSQTVRQPKIDKRFYGIERVCHFFQILNT